MAFFQGETLWVNELADSVAAIVLDVPERKENIVTEQMLIDFESALERIRSAAKFTVLIVRSGKAASFCCSIDLAEMSGKNSNDIARLQERGQKLCTTLAEFPVPTVAVIAGTCLGAGLELALACDYRVVVNRPATQLGMNQLEIGLIPAWGGTQRLPATIGLERALQMILGGRRLDAREAAAWHLADEITEDDAADPPAFLAQPAKVRREALPRLNWRQRLVESNRLGRWLIFRGTERVLQRRLPDDMPAPWEAVNAVRRGLKESFAAGLAAEIEAVRRLADGPAHRNLLRLSIQREEARRVFSPRQRDHDRVRRIGIIGGGPLAIPLTQLAVFKDGHIVVRERNELGLGVSMLQLVGLFQKAVEMGLLSAADMNRKLSAVHGTTAWKGFDEVDLVIDASETDLAGSRALYQEMEQHVPRSAILASTSPLFAIADLQQEAQEPGRMAGVNFFQPLPRSALVEVVRSDRTDEKVARKLAEWVAWLGKLPLLVHDLPGLVVYRVLLPYLSEAVRLVSEGVNPDRVDEAMRRFGMSQGPLEYLDQMGLDKAERLAEIIEPILGDRFPSQPAFALMAEQGWLGQKAGLGFYRHGRRPKVHQAAVDLCIQAREVPALTEPTTPREQAEAVRRRLVGLLINEAARCLAEGRVGSAPAVDLAMVLGGGWPAHRGGPLAYAEQSGYTMWVQTLEELARSRGGHYAPSAELRRLAGL